MHKECVFPANPCGDWPEREQVTVRDAFHLLQDIRPAKQINKLYILSLFLSA